MPPNNLPTDPGSSPEPISSPAPAAGHVPPPPSPKPVEQKAPSPIAAPVPAPDKPVEKKPEPKMPQPMVVVAPPAAASAPTPYDPNSFLPPLSKGSAATPPVAMKIPHNREQGKKLLFIIIAIVVVVCAAVGVYAFTSKLNLFSSAPYNVDQLATSIAKGVSHIDSASYAMNVAVVSQPLDADAVPFSVAIPKDAAREEAYKKDQDKMRDIQALTQALRLYRDAHKAYPASLSVLEKIPATQNPAFTYTQLTGGSDYTLRIIFDSADAIGMIDLQRFGPKDSIKVQDKSVTITGSTALYSYYLPNDIPQPALINVLNMQNSLNYIPANFKLNGTLSGASQKISDTVTNGQAHIVGDVDLGDLHVAVDTEFRKIGEDFYVMLSKFPTLFIDLSKFKDSWIKITPKDLDQYGSYIPYVGTGKNSTQDKLMAAKEKTAQALKKFLEVADANHALVSTEAPKKETINGVSTFRYELQFNKATLPQFYTDLTKEFAKIYNTADATFLANPLAFDQATLEYLKSPEFDQVFEYFRKNTTVTLWAAADGTPIQARYALRMVPENKQKKPDHQIRMTLTLTLSDINKTVQINPPSSSISVEDATILMTGQSKETYQFNKQIRSIESIRRALTTYYSLSGVYPDQIEDLLKTYDEVKKLAKPTTAKPSVPSNVMVDINRYPTTLTTQQILTQIPTDATTNQPFDYSKKGDDYQLIYNVVLPPYVNGDTVQGLYTVDYSTQATPGGKSKIIFKAVSGKNTANAKSVSVEAAVQSRTDTDADGLPDVLENYIGTNRNKKDSDGDGYTDYDEIQRNSNPIGPGNLTGGTGYYF